MAKRVHESFPAADVWSAASWTRAEPVDMPRDRYSLKRRMAELVKQPSLIPQTHRDQAQEMIIYFQGLVFRMLSDDMISPWLTSVIQQAQADEISEVHWGLILSAVRSYSQLLNQDDQRQKEKLHSVSSQCIGVLGEKVKLNLEVIRSVYSEKWRTFYVTAVIIGSSDLVFFSFKQFLDSGLCISIQGTVRDHFQCSKDGNRTRLNRVRALDTVAETA